MKENWVIHSKRADFNRIAMQFQVSPMLARIMRNRDVITDEEIQQYLTGTLAEIPSPYLLKDVEKAAAILKEKIEQKKKIRIISDYDVDGVSSNFILLKGLQRVGANVDYKIPDRMEDGYGINEHLIACAKEDGIDTIVTCDNGIAALAQIDYANELGMTVIVTDHHEVPYEEVDGNVIYQVPRAAAVVNPKQEDCSYPEAHICGAVVCYKFIQVVYDLFGIAPEEIETFLPIVALATECDVMPLRGENRILVKEGLQRIEETEIVGLRALLEANHMENRKISSYDLGFVIGPCINASGRLQTAQKSLELLLCEEKTRALEMAEELTLLNAKRKDMTKQGVEQALQYLKETGREEDRVLVVYLPDCHESIAGIIAGRIREHYNKPTFVLTKAKEGVKGSGRSIEPYSMYDEMTKVKDCFTKYGGHPMAAGLSMEEDRVEEFRRRLNENTTLQESDFISKIMIDIAIPFTYITEGFIQELSKLEPFGNGNEKPLFAQRDVTITGLRVLGASGRCTKMFLKDADGVGIEAMYFGESALFIEDLIAHFGAQTVERLQRGLRTNAKMHITYYPRINEWRDQRTMQVIIQNYRCCDMM